MSKTRAFLELAARLRPVLNKPRLARPSSAKLAESERRGARFRDPHEEHIALAHSNPEVYGHLTMAYVDPVRRHASDPQPFDNTNLPGPPKTDGGW